MSGIRDYTAERNGTKPLNERMAQAAALALRVAATLGDIDSRWDKLTDRLSEARENMQVIRAKTLRRIRLAAVAIALLVLWMGAGQVALSLYGWQGIRRGRTERPPR